jgi:outer membrane lipoprotein-sorting protein
LKALLWKGGLLIFYLSFIASCALLRPDKTPKEILSSSDLLQRVQARNFRIQSLRAVAKVTINHGETRFRLEELITVKKPVSLRVEALSLIGQPLLYFTTDGEVFEILIPGENRFYRGAPSLKHLSSFFPFCLEIEEIVPLMVGEMSWADGERLTARYSQREKLYVVKEDISEGSRRIFWINPFHFALVRASELDHQQNPQWEVLFSKFRKRDGIPFPTDIEFRSPGSGSWMKMHLLEWQVNPSLAERTFRLKVPKGVEIIEMK